MATLLLMELTKNESQFVLHWGEMGSRWGVNRTVAQIHALLFVMARPMNADEIVETLNVARSNVSNSIKELQSWQLVKLTHVMGDRRDHFETSGDVWELFRIIVRGRKQREIDPTINVLRELTAAKDFGKESAAFQERVGASLEFLEVLTAWSDEMMRLSPPTLVKILKMGASVQGLVRGAKK
ncbi:MAG TPA: MarR family transcriptional regulator [Rhodocyclaceae bacterium]|nr:MarR family transcriptional regulator [Rhodocyclaceae bacterium]